MKYEILTVGGDLLTEWETTEAVHLPIAMEDAKTRLREDPELGEVHVYADGTYIGCAAHAPDSDWQSVVVWLWDGERVLPPAGIPPVDDHGASAGYSLDDPKHPTYHERMSDFADLRD